MTKIKETFEIDEATRKLVMVINDAHFKAIGIKREHTTTKDVAGNISLMSPLKHSRDAIRILMPRIPAGVKTESSRCGATPALVADSMNRTIQGTNDEDTKGETCGKH